MKKTLLFILAAVLSCNAIKSQHFELISIDKELGIKMKNCLAVDSKNNLYVGTDKGLLEYMNDTWNLIQFDDSYNNVKEVFIDSKDRIWCYMQQKTGNTIHGKLYKIDNEEKIYINPFIESAFVNSIVEDDNEDIWVSTGKMGYYKVGDGFSLKKKDFPSGIYRLRDSIWHREAMGGYTEKIIATQGKIFFLDEKGAGDKGYWYSNDELKELPTKSFWGKQRVLDIAESSDRKLWVCTAENRLQIYNMDATGELKEVLKVNPYRYGPIGKFNTINDNLYLTYLGMFFAYDKENGKWIYPEKQSNQKLRYYIRDIEELSDGSVLIGTGEGIKQYRNGVISKPQILEGIGIRIVHALSENLILIGTAEEGLFLLENQNLTQIETDFKGNLLPKKYTILRTYDNKIHYLNTTSGVLKITMN